MMKTQFVTDHEKKIVKAERELHGYVKVFLAFLVLNTIISIVLNVFVGFPIAFSCLSNPSRTDEECYTQASTIRFGINLLSLAGTSTLISSKLKKDSVKRYAALEEKS